VDEREREVRVAIAASAAERAALARSYPADREARLRARLDALTAARAPLARQLRHAPKATARFYAPEVRALSAEVGAERKRIEKMLYTQSRPKPKPLKRRPRPISSNILLGTVRQAKGELAGHYATLDDLERVRQPGLAADPSHYFEFVKEAREVRDEAKAARLRIAEAQRRLKLSHVYAEVTGIKQKRLDRADAEANAVKRELEAIERRASRLAAARLGKRFRRIEPWTRAEAIHALDEWARHRAWRWPTARELPLYLSLPSRTTLGSLGISLVRHRPAFSPS
jgi:hypothetical protein